MAEDSGTAAPDPRVEMVARAEWSIRVRVDDAKRQAIELAMVEALADVHARYPNGIKSSHIAVFLTAAALRVLTEP